MIFQNSIKFLWIFDLFHATMCLDKISDYSGLYASFRNIQEGVAQ